MDTSVAHSAGGVIGIAWGTTEVVGIVRGTIEIGEAGDEGVVQGLAVGPPTSVLWVV
jgi:hypothetical protein